MTAVEYFEKNIRFSKASDITGRFDLSKYRFLEKPCRTLDDPNVRRMTIFKASGCMGTVFLQMALAFDIERQLGDIQMVAQTDDDAKDWTKTRGKDFILKLPGVARLIKNDKYAVTNDLWMFAHKFVKVSGPGESNQQSKQVHRLRTDESHLFLPGVLTAFQARMGGKWNRHELHTTTAPDKGIEVDSFFMSANQDEFHYKCLKCSKLVWPLWEHWSKEYYNGERVFRWTESQSEAETLDSLRMVCPHCQNEFEDSTRNRYDLQTDGDYVAMNPDAPADEKSFRWSCFGAFWMTWKERLVEWRKALYAEKMGDLSKMEEYEKKRLCMQYVPTLHNLDGGSSGRDHKLSDVWIVEEECRQVGSFDVQDAPLHMWGGCRRFKRNGDSRLVNYTRLENWQQVKSFQEDHSIKPQDCVIDVGHRFSEVLGKLSEWHWYGLQATDLDFFVENINGTPTPNRYYGPRIEHDALIGKEMEIGSAERRKKIQISRQLGQCPPGFALVRQWSKPNVGFVLLALKSNSSGRYFGIANDAPDFYVKQLHTYIEAIDINARRGTSKRFLRQLSQEDHAFAVESQILVLASIAGFFPMDFSVPLLEKSA